MPEAPGPAPRLPRRRWLAALGAVVALLILAAVGLLHYARPEHLTALLVRQVRERVGVELGLGAPARYGFFPRLHLELPQASLKASAAAMPILGADAIDVVVPWNALWSATPSIDRIELDHPRLDLDALTEWLAARSAAALPPIPAFRLRIDQGSLLRAGKPLASGIDLDLASAGDVSAWLAHLSVLGTGVEADLLPPVDGTAKVRSIRMGATEFDGITFGIRESVSPAPAGRSRQSP